MKLTLMVIVVCASLAVIAQPGKGNQGNGNNGNGNGGCPNPPCGGPNSVPIDVEWLIISGLVVGCYIKFSKSRNIKP